MKFLKTLCLTSAVSAHENELAELIRSELIDFADGISSDAIGNLIVHKKGKGKKILFCAPMDECGGLVTFVEKSGSVRFAKIGSRKLECYLNSMVTFNNSAIGIVKCENNNLNEIKFSDLYIDTPFCNADSEEKSIEIGDVFSVELKYIENKQKIITSSGGNKLCVYALCEAIKAITNTDNDLYFVFSTRGEEGYKGARTAAKYINADYTISIEYCLTNGKNIKEGSGAVINVKDPSFIFDRELLDNIKQRFTNENIEFTLAADAKKVSQAGIMWEAAGGKTGGICLPVNYGEDIYCMVKKSDILSLSKAISTIAESKF